ncbi:obg family GTPase CgtA [Polychytrium aggregatum]|uniref:obg family GTPase CgtA n=1 Tax=Polychytrium aggregatum TaxID=110093 RepID=UPI0022FF2B69|nr:obg family GTPase CgtA [Polychytrium aggregatum]KAI9208550.1 obg family GTPase CgtA [Polychytrium aggregatum]
MNICRPYLAKLCSTLSGGPVVSGCRWVSNGPRFPFHSVKDIKNWDLDSDHQILPPPSTIFAPSKGRRTRHDNFLDFKRIRVTAGGGGDGSIAFSHSAVQPFGPPCGGNGGRGGNVYIMACKDITSLNGILNNYTAANGTMGSSNNMHGANGEDMVIRVPVGTLVRQVQAPIYASSTAAELGDDEGGVEAVGQDETENADEDEIDVEEQNEIYAEQMMRLLEKHFKFKTNYRPREDRARWLMERLPPKPYVPPPVLLDLTVHGEKHLIARGGRGGQGNPHFVTHEIKGPAICERGEKKEPVWLEFELKSIADAGLVGLPNAGKSTLLAAISNAHPKIAPYPFTTLNPYIGTIDYSDFWTMTLADIPGLVEGAHLNYGLGHQFLKHVERTKVLVYVVDLAGKEPWRDFEILQAELEAYKTGLTARPTLVVANKADLPRARSNMEEFQTKVQYPIVPISAKERRNITHLTGALRSIVEKAGAQG